MKKETMLRLIPEMCMLAADPDVRADLDACLHGPAAEKQLVTAIARHPEAQQMHAHDMDAEALALLRLCTQCRAGEMMMAAAGCTGDLTPDGLALLVNERRRHEAMLRYGLQLLWRMCGDEAIPDAIATFPEQSPARRGEDVIRSLVTRLEGGGSNA